MTWDILWANVPALPRTIATDKEDKIWLTDEGANIREYMYSDNSMTQIASTGSLDGIVLLTGMAYFMGNLYVATMDTTGGNYNVYRYDGTPITGWINVASVSYTDPYEGCLTVRGTQLILTTCDGDVLYTSNGTVWSSGTTQARGNYAYSTVLSPVKISEAHAKFYNNIGATPAWEERRSDGNDTWTLEYSDAAAYPFRSGQQNWVIDTSVIKFSETWSGFAAPAVAVTDLPYQENFNLDVGLLKSGTEIYFHQFDGSAWDAGELIINSAMATYLIAGSASAVRLNSGRVVVIMKASASLCHVMSRPDLLDPPVDPADLYVTFHHGVGSFTDEVRLPFALSNTQPFCVRDSIAYITSSYSEVSEKIVSVSPPYVSYSDFSEGLSYPPFDFRAIRPV